MNKPRGRLYRVKVDLWRGTYLTTGYEPASPLSLYGGDFYHRLLSHPALNNKWVKAIGAYYDI